MRILARLSIPILSVMFLVSPYSIAGERDTRTELSDSEAYEIALEAYIYFYPLITMDVSRRVMTNVPAGVKPGMGPMNAFHHLREFPSADFRSVVRPNFDTLYSSAWIDLTTEPMIISAPDTNGRYYLLPMLDMWTDVFAVPGKRTSGTVAGQFAIVPENWNGSLPAGVERIESPTSYVWIIGRTQTNGPSDYDAVNDIQDGFTVTPLSAWGGPIPPVTHSIDSMVDMQTPPLEQVNAMSASNYFSYGAEIMKKNRPHHTDWSQLKRMERIGLLPGASFSFANAPANVRSALVRASKDGLAMMKSKFDSIAREVNGWQIATDGIGVYGDSYLKRAIIAMTGLGANQPEDAVYPICEKDSEGRPFDGASQYVLHFSKGELPPVDAFWSLTMYDVEGFPIPNTSNRYAIGDRDALVFNADGSLDLYIQSSAPGGDRNANWLPSPESGAFSLLLRLYASRAEVVDGRWVPPAVVRRTKH